MSDDLARYVMLIYGPMEQGGRFWAYVAIKPSKIDDFQAKMKAKALYPREFEAQGFGEIIVSGEGNIPPQEVTYRVAKLYGLPLNELLPTGDPKAILAKKLPTA